MTHELVIREERFACRDELSSWALMKLAKSAQGTEMQALAGMYELVTWAVLADERERLETYMADADVPFDELNAAIGELMKGYTNRPTERPSPSPAGPMPTPAPSRVVSLSRRAETPKPSSTGGAREVS